MRLAAFAPLFLSPIVGLKAGESTGIGAAANWAHHGGGVDEASYSQLSEIDRRNVRKLGLAWHMDLPGEVSLEATPLAIDGVLYFTGSYASVYAVDPATGKLLWRYDPEIWKKSPLKQSFFFGVNRGVAHADGRLFLGVTDGRLVALDAKTGKELWTANTVPPTSIHTITGAPRVFNGKVIIGNGGADAGMRGYVTAYDQKTGEQLWRFHTVPGKPEENEADPIMKMAAATWSGEYWKTGTGGTVWNDMTFDPELNRIYLGVGNAGPYNPVVRSPGNGDNLFVASIVALDADTGKYVWHYQQNPRESWDYKAVANMISTTLTIDGKPRRVLMQSPTNGFFYVLDRDTGKLISAEKTGKVTWAERIDLETGRPVEAPNIRYEKGDSNIWPSMLGTHNWQDMAFSPRTGLVYIPYMQMGATFTTNVKPGEFSFGGMAVRFLKADKNDGTGALLAWDPVAQKPRWKARHPFMWNGGALATGGDLVFQGTAEGLLQAYDAKTGKKLWQYDAGLGIIAPPISYVANGQQMVSVLVGWGGTTAAASDVLDVGWKYGVQPRRLLTFALGGKDKLEPSAPRNLKINAVDDPSIVLNEDDIKAGQKLSVMCIACHGIGFRSSGAPAPDLRESPMILSDEAMWSVLHDGALAERGMPKYPVLTKGQVKKLQVYILSLSREAAGTRAPSAEKPALESM